jgi:hypothetical protein
MSEIVNEESSEEEIKATLKDVNNMLVSVQKCGTQKSLNEKDLQTKQQQLDVSHSNFANILTNICCRLYEHKYKSKTVEYLQCYQI